MDVSEAVCCTVSGEPTVRVAEPLFGPDDALIADVPIPTPLASPELFTAATAGLDEPQVAELVISCIVPSLYTPIAASCCVWPVAIAGVAGVTDNELRVG